MAIACKHGTAVDWAETVQAAESLKVLLVASQAAIDPKTCAKLTPGSMQLSGE